MWVQVSAREYLPVQCAIMSESAVTDLWLYESLEMFSSVQLPEVASAANSAANRASKC